MGDSGTPEPSFRLAGVGRNALSTFLAEDRFEEPPGSPSERLFGPQEPQNRPKSPPRPPPRATRSTPEPSKTPPDRPKAYHSFAIGLPDRPQIDLNRFDRPHRATQVDPRALERASSSDKVDPRGPKEPTSRSIMGDSGTHAPSFRLAGVGRNALSTFLAEARFEEPSASPSERLWHPFDPPRAPRSTQEPPPGAPGVPPRPPLGPPGVPLCYFWPERPPPDPPQNLLYTDILI